MNSIQTRPIYTPNWQPWQSSSEFEIWSPRSRRLTERWKESRTVIIHQSSIKVERWKLQWRRLFLNRKWTYSGWTYSNTNSYRRAGCRRGRGNFKKEKEKKIKEIKASYIFVESHHEWFHSWTHQHKVITIVTNTSGIRCVVCDTSTGHVLPKNVGNACIYRYI